MKDLASRLADLSPEQLNAISKRLSERREAGEPDKEIRRQNLSGVQPVSSSQFRLWVLNQLDPGHPVYNLHLAFRFRGPLNRQLLNKAINAIVERHEVLRTTFDFIGGEPVQVIHAFHPIHLTFIDLSGLASEDQESESLCVAFEEAKKSFDLRQGPLFRPVLIRLNDEKHVVLLTMHHIISDGWSSGILAHELAVLYDSFCAGIPSPLPHLPLQYADYARWEREWLRGPAQEDHLAYWKRQLADAQSLLDLPSDRARPAKQTFAGAWEFAMLPSSLMEALTQLGKRENASMFMTMLTAFQTLLHRYSGQEDLSVGAPIANRNRVEIERLIGLFVNTLVIRTDASGAPTFLDLLRRVRKTVLDAYAHQELPFERVVEAIEPERDLSHSPLFQVMFVFNELNRQQESSHLVKSAIHADSLSMKLMETHAKTSMFDQTLHISHVDDKWTCSVEYNSEMFEVTRIRRMIRHFQGLLESIVAAPNCRIADLALLSESERCQVLVEWNDTSCEYEYNGYISGLFGHQVDRTPDATAVAFEGNWLSYGELDRRASCLAHCLQGLGVGPDLAVGLYMERSLEMSIALLGVLKAGGAYIPLDPSHPVQRTSLIIDEAKVGIVLTQRELKSRLADLSTNICLDSECDTIEQLSKGVPLTKADGNNLAYVIYTSGSTGTPKGAMISLRSLCNRLLWMQETLQLGAENVVLHKTPYIFDVSVWELFLPLLVGGRLVIAKPGGHQDTVYLVELIEKEQITAIHFVPSLLEAFLEEPAVYRCESLETVVCSGEALPPRLVPRFFNTFKAKLYNLYGPTEATIDVTYWNCGSAAQTEGVFIGKPIANTQIYILDKRMTPVPVGVPGELYIGGTGLARGYLRRSDLTAENFVPNQYGGAGSISYRTGDSGRYHSDGNIEYLGRRDKQVKIRGYRVELGEVEAVLDQHPAIRESLVVLREDRSKPGRLVAYVAREGVADIDLAEIRSFLGNRLPAYMVPNNIMVLDRIPRTQTGKADRNLLPLPSEESELGTQYEPPATPMEIVLVEIWNDVLGIQTVGRRENFFALGGDSIRGLQVAARAKAKGLDLSLQMLYQHPTVQEVAQAVMDMQMEDDQALVRADSQPFALLSLEDREKLPHDASDAYPLSLAQAGLLFDTEGFPESHFYHEISSYRLEAPLDIGLLKHTIENIVALHPILRTSFDLTNYSRPMQIVHQGTPITILVSDISNKSVEEHEQVLAAYVETDMRQQFIWSSAPLCRIAVHILTTRTFQFTISYHHAILDGWSATSLVYEMFNNYLEGLKKGGATIGRPLKSTVRDFIAVEEYTLKSKATKEFWLKKLEGCTQCILPQWPFHPVNETSGYLKVQISPGQYEATLTLARTMGVPVKSLLLAAHVTVLSLLTGSDEVLTGLLLNGRLESNDGERVLGYFLNPIPLRLKTSVKNITELIQSAYRAECEVLPYRRYPFPQILVDQGRRELFDTYFVLTDFHELKSAIQLDGLRALKATHYGNDSYFSLIVGFNVNASDSTLELALYYNPLRLGRDQVKSIGDYYARALKHITANPEKELRLEELIDEVEGTRRIWALRGEMQEIGLEAFLHLRFERQAHCRPDEIAAAFREEFLTYGEFNRSANQLAHYLKKCRIGPERLIGVYLDRSLEMLVGLLGVIKSGAAYLPIDPDYPQERIALILEDADCRLLLTQEKYLADIASLGLSAICLDREREHIRRENDEDLAVETAGDNLAYVIYTSGSTGTPKGVQISHRSVANLLRALEGRLNFTERSILLAVTTISFDISVLEIFIPLVTGGRVELAGREEPREIPRLLQRLRQSRATHLQATPSLWRLMLEAGWEGHGDLKMLSGGEALPRDLAQELLKRASVLWNLYGPTETTIWSAFSEVKSMVGSVVIGKPIANTQVYILDEHLQPVGVGVAGEIYIGGEGLSRGYLNRSDQTGERFLPNCYGEAGTRMYRSGDVGRLTGDAEIEYLGRRDAQVKIRGYRVELGEIEAVLNQHPSVRESAAVVRELEGDKQLVAYASVNGAGVTRQELSAQLARKLPEYMRARVEIVKEPLPRTPNGKIDRALLSDWEQRQNREAGRLEARTEMERHIVSIWEEVLGVKGLGINEDFFDLGGHSLLAMRLIARLREAFDVELSVRGLFRFPTVGELATAIAEFKRESEKAAIG